MSDAEPEVEVTIDRNDGAGRYEAFVAGELAGYAEFRALDGGIAFTHTVVDRAYEGRGVGAKLAAAALDQAREDGLRVSPACSFIKDYIDRHPAYLDLVSS